MISDLSVVDIDGFGGIGVLTSISMESKNVSVYFLLRNLSKYYFEEIQRFSKLLLKKFSNNVTNSTVARC